AVAEKLLNSLAEPYRLVTTTAVGKSTLENRCTTSIGITLFRFHQDSVEEMLKRADAAMYQAKGAGRNAIRFFDPAMQKVLLARSEMEGQLHQSLDRHELLLHYQMQVNADGSPIGVELLLRWNHPERGMIPPLDFIPLAEDNGYIVPIGLWVLNMACRQLKRWQGIEQLEKLELAVNVSARQFKQTDFVGRVREALNETGINPALLKIELTESVILDNVKEAISKMRELKELGVSLSMDDFGTGYSSLSYLQRMPLDELKIDQSFVRDMLASNNSENIVKTIIMLANGMNMSMIAEGVETQEQFEFLTSKGCSGFQGYLFSRPLPLQAFEKKIMECG
ncbi:MAG: GGDEF domain-containing phosphodiesterase, partial [Gallionellaceae bacterium]